MFQRRRGGERGGGGGGGGGVGVGGGGGGRGRRGGGDHEHNGTVSPYSSNIYPFNHILLSLLRTNIFDDT